MRRWWLPATASPTPGPATDGLPDVWRAPVVSRVTESLYVGALPRPEQAAPLAALGVRLIISLSFQRPPSAYYRSPFRVLRLTWPDSPLFPLPLSLLERGVRAARPEVAAGRPVLVHCRGGVHRSVAVAACILIAEGRSPDEAMRLIKEARPLADPYAWHVQPRIRLFAARWQRQAAASDPPGAG